MHKEEHYPACEYVMLMGLAGSGKSTLSKKLLAQKDYEYICLDEFRLKYFGDYIMDKDSTEMFTEIRQLEKDCVQKGKSILYDAVNISNMRRKNLIQIIKKHNPNVQFKLIYLERDLETSIKQNNLRKGMKKLPENVIRHQRSELKKPHYREGWDKIYYEKGDGILHLMEYKNRQ